MFDMLEQDRSGNKVKDQLSYGLVRNKESNDVAWLLIGEF